MRFEEIGEGVTKPVRLHLKKEAIQASGAWENPSGIQEGYLESGQDEIAACELFGWPFPEIDPRPKCLDGMDYPVARRRKFLGFPKNCISWKG